jgi:hypothetical protein
MTLIVDVIYMASIVAAREYFYRGRMKYVGYLILGPQNSSGLTEIGMELDVQ